MHKILALCTICMLPSLALADIHRCVSIKPDTLRLACFDAEIKSLSQLPVTAPGVSASRPRSTSDANCYTGPRGGRYRMVNGHKRYDC
jgi:hypothetical protein